MASRNFYNQIKGLTLREVPAFIRPKLTLTNIKSSVKKGIDNYGDKYIETDSIVPVYHVCFGGMALSYLLALPEERRRHEAHQHAH